MLDWKPSEYQLQMISEIEKYQKKNVFRNWSGAYTYRPQIRNHVMTLYNYQCNYCGSVENLQIDHIIPVSKAIDLESLLQINTVNNLQVLCRSCNIKKGKKLL